jgi:hypothetical protein
MTQPREAIADGFEHVDGAIAILNIVILDQHEEQEATGIGEDVTLATLDVLARIIAANTAALAALTFGSVVFTDWLSITPALGLASRPACSRAVITSKVLIVVSKPLSRQA